jgi:TetR/AcrR family transcriptional regulator, mexJK operon transcriptional repressor
VALKSGATRTSSEGGAAPPSTPPGGRARILAVARAAFIERGYADVSMQEIADAAGLTKAAIYYHFADKEQLFNQVFLDEVDRLYSGVEAQLAPGPPLRDQLERVARYAFESGRGDFGRLVADAHRYCGADHVTAMRERVLYPYALVRAAFAQARDAGEIRDVDLDVTTALFFSMVGGQLKVADAGLSPSVPPETLAAAVADMVVRGIGA